MLISPLMGPIVGAGVALGVSDVALLRRSLRNLFIATFVALLSSTAYFFVSPLAEAQSELLARTRPTLYDVLIALFGGAAGIIAVSRRANKSHVVPGVAIATALMPPLCTAGFGLAHGDWRFFLGAMHLFLINALFICLATLGFVRLMRFERATTHDAASAPRVRWLIIALTLGIALPSVYTGWQVVQETRFQGAARRFVADQLLGSDHTFLNVSLRYGRDSSTIEATQIGEPMRAFAIDSLTMVLPRYGLARTRLIVRQPLARQPSVEEITELIRQGVLKDADARMNTRRDLSTGTVESLARPLQEEFARIRAGELPTAQLARELGVLYPSLSSLAMGRVATVAVVAADTTRVASPMPISVVASWKEVPNTSEVARVRAFLALRLGTESIRLTNIVAR